MSETEVWKTPSAELCEGCTAWGGKSCGRGCSVVCWPCAMRTLKGGAPAAPGSGAGSGQPFPRFDLMTNEQIAGFVDKMGQLRAHRELASVVCVELLDRLRVLAREHERMLVQAAVDLQAERKRRCSAETAMLSSAGYEAQCGCSCDRCARIRKHLADYPDTGKNVP